MDRAEFESKIFEMMKYAAKAKEIGDEIADALDGGDELYDLLNEIQDCEVTEIGTALEVYEYIIKEDN